MMASVSLAFPIGPDKIEQARRWGEEKRGTKGTDQGRGVLAGNVVSISAVRPAGRHTLPNGGVNEQRRLTRPPICRSTTKPPL